jgi:hypothetical protein
MQLSKTDFIQYLNCPKSLWILKREPEKYPHGEFSAFLKKLVREGYEVENLARQFLTQETGRNVKFQVEYRTNDGLYARVDAVEVTSEGKTILFEVKSSTDVDRGDGRSHIKDACFQKVCAERSGQKIDGVYLVHLNGHYIRGNDLDLSSLLVFHDISNDVSSIENETTSEIDAALKFLANDLDKSGCSCINKSRSNHCDTFYIFNPHVPRPSIFSIPRINEIKRTELLSAGITDLKGIPDTFSLSDKQQLLVQAAKCNAPQINLGRIKAFLSSLVFPLHFFDYETFSPAIPKIMGTKPWQHIPVQYSVHILDEKGSLTHHEFLARELCPPLELIEQMERHFQPTGTVLSWHASFESTRNREMAKAFPAKADFLNDVNERMVDLEKVFINDYIDVKFEGYSSIKKVLPVICPNLNYKDLEVQEGGSAMEAWERMVSSQQAEADKIAQALLQYCERDTYAMVEIYRFLNQLPQVPAI